jgi:hypothetical protein
LRAVTQVTGFCYALAPLECCWSLALAGLPGAEIPARGFGASDCRANPIRCPAHLAAFPGILDPNLMCCVLAQAGNLPAEALKWATVPFLESTENTAFIG